MKRAILQLGCLMLAASICYAQEEHAAPAKDLDTDEARAQKFVEQFFFRFCETLDVRALKSELAQKDEAALREEFEKRNSESLAHGLAAKIDRALLEQAWLSAMNFELLGDIFYELGPDDEEERTKLGKQIMEQEILPRLKAKQNIFYQQFVLLLTSEAETVNDFFFTKREEIVANVEGQDIFSDVLREHLKTRLPDNKPKIEKSWADCRQGQDDEGGRLRCTVELDVNVMLMRPRFTVVEENGAFKIDSALHD